MRLGDQRKQRQVIARIRVEVGTVQPLALLLQPAVKPRHLAIPVGQYPAGIAGIGALLVFKVNRQRFFYAKLFGDTAHQKCADAEMISRRSPSSRCRARQATASLWMRGVMTSSTKGATASATSSIVRPTR